MDGDISEQAPWTSELLVLAMALVGLAWLTLVFCLRWQLRTKAVAALPGLATVVMALAVAATIGEGERGEDHPLHTMLPVAVEWSALFASAILIVIMTLRMPQGADDEPHQDHRSRPYDAADLS